MAEVKKINGYDITDYRITGVDTVVTEDSAKVVTSGAVYDAIETGGSALAEEIARAKAREDELEVAIGDEEDAREAADTELTTALSTETQTRSDADDELEDAIAAEASTRAAADISEATTRSNADTALGNLITNETNARTSADTALTTAINNEKSAREGADDVLEDAISAEATTRFNTDTALSQRISNLESLGRYLALWNCTTGLPTTEPTTALPYLYRTGDYFRVGIVSSSTPRVNYRPNGDRYKGTEYPSSTIETEDVQPGDVYFYDGTNWSLQINHIGGLVTDVKVNGDSKLDGTEAKILIKTINTQSIVGEGDLTINSLPEQSGHTNQFLKTNGETASWATVDALPSQSGQAGKYLTTNGTAASWSTPSDLPIISVATGTLVAGQTTLTVSYTGTVVGVYTTKANGEKILTDYTINNNSVVFELGAAVDFNIICKVATTTTSVPDANTEEF